MILGRFLPSYKELCSHSLCLAPHEQARRGDFREVFSSIVYKPGEREREREGEGERERGSCLIVSTYSSLFLHQTERLLIFYTLTPPPCFPTLSLFPVGPRMLLWVQCFLNLGHLPFFEQQSVLSFNETESYFRDTRISLLNIYKNGEKHELHCYKKLLTEHSLVIHLFV